METFINPSTHQLDEKLSFGEALNFYRVKVFYSSRSFGRICSPLQKVTPTGPNAKFHSLAKGEGIPLLFLLIIVLVVDVVEERPHRGRRPGGVLRPLPSARRRRRLGPPGRTSALCGAQDELATVVIEDWSWGRRFEGETDPATVFDVDVARRC